MSELEGKDRLRKEKKARIIEAAAQVFAQKGYAGASVADIAIQADIGKGTVYEYFDSKEALFFAVFQWYMEKTRAAATVSISALGHSASEQLVALNDAIMGLWDEIRDSFVLVMEFWAASSSSQLRERFKVAFQQVYEEFRGVVSSLIRDGMERGEFRSDVSPELVAAALVGTWDALFLQAWFEEKFNPLKAAQNFLIVVLRGLKTDREGVK